MTALAHSPSPQIPAKEIARLHSAGFDLLPLGGGPDAKAPLCSLVEGKNLSATVIAAGHALDCPKYSGGRYKHLETVAAKSRIKRASYCLKS